MGIPNACCCGGTTCTIFSEATAVDVADWTQDSGTWTNSGGSPNYIETSSANALIVHDTPNPDGLSTGAVIFKFNLPTTGALRLCLAYLDASNYLFAEVENDASDPTASQDVTIRLGHRTAGADTFLEEFNGYKTATFSTLTLCYTGSRISLAMGSMLSHEEIKGIKGMDSPLTGTWGTQIAVQTIGIAGTLQFYNVGFYGVVSLGCIICSAACEACTQGVTDGQGQTPGEVSVYLEDVTNSTCGNCVALFEGATFILENAIEPPAPGPAWATSTAYGYATRSCAYALPGSTGGCFNMGADMMRFVYGIFGVNTARLLINDDATFTFSKTGYVCTETLTKVNGTNIGFPQQCDWSAATAVVTPNMA